MTDDFWGRQEANRKAIVDAGIREVGEKLRVEHYCGERQSREEIMAERKRKAEWLRRVRKRAGW